MAPRKKPSFEARLEAIRQTLELVAAMQLVTERELSQLSKLSKTVLTSHEARLLRLERKK